MPAPQRWAPPPEVQRRMPDELVVEAQLDDLDVRLDEAHADALRDADSLARLEQVVSGGRSPR